MCAHNIHVFKEYPMNITLSVDEQVAQRAREAAQKMGKSLNQVVRDYLEQLAGGARRGQQWTQFEERCLNSKAKLEGWQFNRDEANER
jgi:replicative DNA helicase